jgi:rubrerythrin
MAEEKIMTADRQQKMLEALKIAIEMENSGKECYQNAIRASHSEAGKKLLQSLITAEDEHRRKLEQIYKAIETGKGWPVVKSQPDAQKKLNELFSLACEAPGIGKRADDTEIGVLNTAITKEKQSYDFYTQQSQNTADVNEKAFYAAVASEEKGHELILVNYAEYLADPVDWFTRVEHHSLDG